MAKARDYAKEYREYHGKPEQIARRAGRNQARRLMIRKYGKAALKGKDVDHKDFNTRNNKPSNLSIKSVRENRGRKPSK